MILIKEFYVWVISVNPEKQIAASVAVGMAMHAMIQSLPYSGPAALLWLWSSVSADTLYY